MKFLVASLACFAAAPALAFECPNHFSEAQEMIDKVSGDMEGIDDAKMLLSGAEHNHEKPQGPYDHARAIAKADAALGYARAADMLHFKYMEQ